jgi:hypothetical protein
MGSFEASYKDFNLHILSAELGGLSVSITQLLCVLTNRINKEAGGIELSAMWDKSWTGAQALSHK